MVFNINFKDFKVENHLRKLDSQKRTMPKHNPKGYLKYDLIILNRTGIVPIGVNLSFLLIYQIKIHLKHHQSAIETLVLFPTNYHNTHQLVGQHIHLQGRNSSVRLDFGHFGNHNLL